MKRKCKVCGKEPGIPFDTCGRRTDQSVLTHALAKICDELVGVGLGAVTLGNLAKHLLKLRKK